jgi:hypothetical protein
MNTPLAVALLLFWCFLAYRSFQRGDMTMALVFLAVGVALTAYRLKSVKKATP